MTSFTPKILTVVLLVFGISAELQAPEASATTNHGRTVASSAGKAECISVISSRKITSPEDYDKIQKYLRQTGKEKLIVESPPDNMPVVVPNTSKYSMPTYPPDMSKYRMPIIKPPLHKK
jgi:hypothetical protein